MTRCWLSSVQVFLPIISTHLHKLNPTVPCPSTEGSSAEADIMLNWAKLQAVFKAAGAGGYATPPEDSGVALTMAAFRLGYFYGGDGESQLKIDLRGAAGFVRHQAACITNFLLPIKVLQYCRTPSHLILFMTLSLRASHAAMTVL